MINLQIGAAYRNKKDYDNAIAAYNDLLKSDPGSDKARIGVAQAYMEKGDLGAAENALDQAAQTQGASKELFYSLGEVEAARGNTDEAVKWYQKAAAERSELGQAAAQAGPDVAEQGRPNRRRRQDAAGDGRRSHVG